MSDAKLILSTLIMGMKTLLYSIANYGNTQQPRTPTAGPTLVRTLPALCSSRAGKRLPPCCTNSTNIDLPIGLTEEMRIYML